jgi:hypothetical protein
MESGPDLPVTVDEDEGEGSDQTLAAEVAAPAGREGDAEDDGSDVVIADDLAVMIDAELDTEEVDATEAKKPTESAPPPGGKRSIPPPLPRA